MGCPDTDGIDRHCMRDLIFYPAQGPLKLYVRCKEPLGSEGRTFCGCDRFKSPVDKKRYFDDHAFK